MVVEVRSRRGCTIVHNDKLHELMSSEEKVTFDESNIQPLGSISQKEVKIIENK